MSEQSARAPITHDLKCWPQYFDALADGSKPFEIRENDRDYRVGDTLRMREYWPYQHEPVDHPDGVYTGREIECEISYVTDWNQRPGYVVLGLKAGPPALLPVPVVTCAGVVLADSGPSYECSLSYKTYDEAVAAQRFITGCLNAQRSAALGVPPVPAQEQVSQHVRTDNELICEKLLGWTRSAWTRGPAGRVVCWRTPNGGESATLAFDSWADVALIWDALDAREPEVILRKYRVNDVNWTACTRGSEGHGISGPLAIRDLALAYIRSMA